MEQQQEQGKKQQQHQQQDARVNANGNCIAKCKQAHSQRNDSAGTSAWRILSKMRACNVNCVAPLRRVRGASTLHLTAEGH